RDATPPSAAKTSTWIHVNMPTISSDTDSVSGEARALRWKMAVPSTVGVDRGCPAALSSNRNHNAPVAAPVRPASMPSCDRRAVSGAGSERRSAVEFAPAVMIGSFPGPIDPLTEAARFYASVPAWLAWRRRPRRGAGSTGHVVHLAVEEDARVAVFDGAATRGACALERGHRFQSSPPVKSDPRPGQPARESAPHTRAGVQ